MARKTPPVAKQVIDPKLSSNAFLKGRLIDFDTASAEFEEQHKAWLREKITIAGSNSMFRVRLVGFASKTGNASFNSNLSFNRVKKVLDFLQSVDSRTADRVETFRAVGEDGYSAAESDNSPEFRAVEVHIFIGDIPPPPPPNVKPTPTPVVPLPGGKRTSEWEVAAPGGGVVSTPIPGLVVGVNFFVIRNKSDGETRTYFSPSLGAGASLSIPSSGAAKAIFTALTAGNFTNLDFEPVKTRQHPITWEELEESLVTVASAGAQVMPGMPVGVLAARITFDAPGVFHHGPSGQPIKTAQRLWDFTSFGKDYQFGAGASAVGGPLVRMT